MPVDPPGILLLSELYPPTIGGSGVLLESLYSRLSDRRVRVVTDGAGSRVQRGLSVTAIPMTAPDWGIVRPASLARHLRVARHVRRLTTRADFVHCGRGLPEGLSALIARRAFACWTHGEELGYASSSTELAWLARRVYSRAAGLLANSHNSARLLRDWGVSVDRIVVVHPGVDAERFHPDSNPGEWRGRYAAEGQTLFLSVGRLHRRKGHDLVLKALAQMAPADLNVRYLIAGDGACRTALEAEARSLGLGDRVVFLGVVPEDALPALYAACDVFLMPNRQDGVDFEGFGIVFLEAAASGLASIGGRSGGVPEAVENGVTGLLVSGTDVTELASAMRKLMARDVRAAMGTAGRARVLREFTWARGAERVAACHRLLADRARPSDS